MPKKAKRRAKQREASLTSSADTPPSAPASEESPQQFTPEQLMTKAQELAETGELEAALSFYQRALQLDANYTPAMDAAAELLVQQNEGEQALQLLEASTRIAPEAGGGFKWLSLAQLQSGERSAASYERGIAGLRATLAGTAAAGSAEAELLHLQRLLCSAHVAVVELYMSDLCFAPTAEQVCEEQVEAAKALDTGTVDWVQACASLRLSQQRNEEAAQLMTEVLRRLQQCYNPLEMPEAELASLPPTAVELPNCDFRLQTAKLLIEVAQHSQAAEVLHGILAEDDRNIETWYLAGMAHDKVGELEEALECLQQAQFKFSKLREQLGGQFEFDQQSGAVEELLKAVQGKIAAGAGSTSAGATAGACATADDAAMDVDDLQ